MCICMCVCVCVFEEMSCQAPRVCMYVCISVSVCMYGERSGVGSAFVRVYVCM
jgi:hypothetical protein